MTTRPGKRTSTQPIDAPQQLLGRVLDGRYRLEEVINVGGMGIIFRAYQLATDRSVAVKVLRPTLAGDIDLATRFQQEISTMSALSHPNIVALFDSGQDVAGLHYLVMEFVQGETLAARLDGQTLSLVEIVEVFAQVCRALDGAHDQRIIHRDLKFENIMVQSLGSRLHVTVLDFGVAKMLSRNDGITRTGEVPGTPGIIAPELVDSVAPSPQSDLYSLGVLMFTALVGEAPFEGDNEFELMRAHQLQDVARIEALVPPEVPEPLIELVYELLQKDPKHRPRDAASVEVRLQTVAAALRSERGGQRYVPVGGDVSAVPAAPREELPVNRSQEFLGGAPTADQELPRVAPTSVIGFLITVLTIVVSALLYLAYRTLVLK